MIRVLITGMSGTGKSSLLAELARRGHRVVDTDDGDWSTDVALPGGGRERVWREDRIASLLTEDGPGCLFVSGCVSNQGRFYDRLEAVILLSAPVEVMLDRVSTRTTNPFGKDPAERERIRQDHRLVEPLLRRTADVEISTDGLPVEQVADAVEAVARRAQAAR